MGFQLGNTEITKMYLGNTEITQAYLGTISLPLVSDAVPPTVGTLSTVVRTNITTTTLTWTAATDNIGVVGYKIYRSSGAADSGFTLLKTLGNVLTTTDATIAEFDDTYFYYVTAIDSAGNESSASNHKSCPQQVAGDIFPFLTPVSYEYEGTSTTVFTSGRYTTVTSDSTDKQVGTYSAKFQSSGTAVQQYRDSFHPVISGKQYVIRFWAKASQSGKSSVRFTTNIPSVTIDVNASTWTEYTTSFTATSTGDMRIYWYSAYSSVDGTEIMWADGFRIYEIGTTVEPPVILDEIDISNGSSTVAASACSLTPDKVVYTDIFPVTTSSKIYTDIYGTSTYNGGNGYHKYLTSVLYISSAGSVIIIVPC